MALFRKFHHLYFLIPGVAYGLLYWILSQTSRNINPDVTIFLEIGNRILDGQQPYVDFYEINFPMIQYLSTIPVFVSRLIGQNVIVVMLLLTWLLIGWAALSCYWLTRQITDDKHLPYIIPLAMIVYSTALHIPFETVSEFGQRDHIFILLFLPYILIRVKQWQDDETDSRTWLRFLYGILAAIGVIIKPFFAIAPILLELYGLRQHKNVHKLLRAETIGFATVAGLQILYFLVFPNIRNGLLDILNASSSYIAYMGGNDSNPIINLVVKEDLRNAMLLFMAVGLIKFRSVETTHLVNVIRLSLVSGILIFSVQRGFAYHTISYQIMVWILMLYIVARFFHPPLEDQTKAYDWGRNPIVYIAILMLVYFFTIYLNINAPQHTEFKELTDYQTFILENTEENEAVFVINNGVAAIYPALHQINRWNSSPYLNHYPYNWGWSRAVGYKERVTAKPLPIVEQWKARVGQSILDISPHLIIIDPQIDYYLTHVGFVDDYMNTGYRKVAEEDDFIAYEKVDD